MAKSKVKRVLNWVPDLPDKRDLYLKVSRFRKLPDAVDLRDKFTPVEDQEDIGSCGAQAFVGNMEYLDKLDDNEWTDLSRLFVYWISRDDKYQDTGVFLRDMIKALAEYGACDEILWPYIAHKYDVKPSKKAFLDALKRRITEYRRIDSFRGVKQALADGFPVAFGFTVFDSFMEIDKDGIMPMPNLYTESTQGGHAVLAVGYTDTHLIVRNSWGANWGEKGYFYMPFLFAEDGDFTADFWTITRSPVSIGEEPWQPDLSGSWYLPITTIIRFIKNLFGKGD